MKIQLSDIPVNPYTTSELVRLCLRKQDVEDDSDNDREENLEDEVVIIPLYSVDSCLKNNMFCFEIVLICSKSSSHDKNPSSGP